MSHNNNMHIFYENGRGGMRNEQGQEASAYVEYKSFRLKGLTDLRKYIKNQNVQVETTSSADTEMKKLNPRRIESFNITSIHYHLALYNTYSPLAEDTQDDHELINNLQSIPFHSLGSSFKVNSDDVDLGGGYRRQRKKLERDKKYKQSGQTVMEAEQRLAGISKNPTKRACKKVFRDFYYSNKRVSITKSVLFLNKRYRDKFCSQERRCAQGEDKKHLVMLIGDRGFGYGSRIKGFRRYGGKWKPQLHGRNTTVCVTNEHKTSQTCVYCFSPIVHPIQR